MKALIQQLPGPVELARQSSKTKVTIKLDRSTIEFFKHKADEHGVKYQTLINSLLASYAMLHREGQGGVDNDEALLRRRPRNLAEVVRQRELGIPDYVANGDFLDAFYAAKPKERQSFLDTEPTVSDSVDITASAFAQFGAMAEKLAHDFSLDVPSWTEKPIYFLDHEHYRGKPASGYALELIEALRKEAPPEFKRRNILVTENVLSRR